jgi:predicted dehydrogenase
MSDLTGYLDWPVTEPAEGKELINTTPERDGRTEPEKQRIGILGCSAIARRRFLPALQKARNASLSVIASRDIEKAKRCFPALTYDAADYDGLLASPDVDLVYISLPNHLHEAWVLRALEAGKHVICEKPLAPSLESAIRMTGYAEQKGLLLYENIMYLHHPQHRIIKTMIASGAIGRVRELRTVFSFTLQDKEGFRTNAQQGGGAFLDLARYPLSAALFFLKGAQYRFNGRAYFRSGLNVAMEANVLTERDERLIFSIGFEQPYECWYEIVGEKGTLRIDRAYTTPADLANPIQVVTVSGAISIAVPAADHFMLMLENVCDLILQERGFCAPYQDARRLALLAEQAWKSCERVDLGGIRNCVR